VQVPRLSDGEVTLRAHTDDDIDRIVEQSRDPLSIEWTTVPLAYSIDDAKRFVRHAMPGGWESEEEWGFAVERDGLFMGTVSLRNFWSGRAEIAYGSHPEARGRGVLSRALRLLLTWGFSPVADGGLGLGVVVWMANRGNWGSRRLAWSVGFSFDGTMRGWAAHRDGLVDAWVGTLRRGEDLSPNRPWLESPTIRGDAVVLRELAERDLPRIVETLNDPETKYWLRRPREGAPHTLESEAGFVTARRADAADGIGVHWAVADPMTDVYLGQISLFDVQHRRQAEVAYWAHPDSRGRGVITEATRLVVRHCFVPIEDGGLGMARLTINAAVGNLASQRVIERAGFQRVGVQRSTIPLEDGTWADSVDYDLLAAELTVSDPTADD
jgi:RimJ/RimL family protein N-acetyltransferase